MRLHGAGIARGALRGLSGLGGAFAGALLAGCSLLVHFDDAPGTCPDGDCTDATAEAAEDATADATADGGTTPDASLDGADAGLDAIALPETSTDTGAPETGPTGPCAKLPDGTYCGYTGGCQCQYCSAGACSTTKQCPQGFNWEAGVDDARCCNGLPILTNTNANCGVCGAQCATAGVTGVQNCALLSGHYQCVDCAANNECWTGCCAIDTTPYHCSESNCNTGACVAGLCPAPSHCVTGSGTPNYCTYD